jgi:hypothetical protein
VTTSAAELYGVIAEFETPEALVAAARRARERGYVRLEGYSPVPIEGLQGALGRRRTRLPLVVFGAGVAGGAFGLWLQYYLTAVNYPLNIAGRPLASWPSFMIITFELTVLVAGLTAGIGMLAANGLPQPHHPLFNSQAFSERANVDRYFLCVEAADPDFRADEVRAFLRGLSPVEVHDVPG